MTFEVTVTAVGLACSLIGGAIGYAAHKLNVSKESEQEGQDKGVLLTEIGYIKAGVDDIKNEQRKQEGRHNELAERVTRVEESAKQAHKRIDRLEKEGDM